MYVNNVRIIKLGVGAKYNLKTDNNFGSGVYGVKSFFSLTVTL